MINSTTNNSDNIFPIGDKYNSQNLYDSNEETKQKINQDNSKDSIQFQIEQIPNDLNFEKCVDKLQPILEDISKTSELKTESYLRLIYTRFKFDSNARRVIRFEIKNKKELSKKKYVKKAIFPGLIDIVDDNSDIKYLILKENELVSVKEYQYKNETFIPPDRMQIPWLLPRVQEVMKYYAQYLTSSTEEINKKLFGDSTAYFKLISDLPNDYYYRYFPIWVTHTYFQEKIHYTPFIVFQGLSEKGKSRTSKALTYTSYRGICIETLREPYIFRAAENYQATLFFDMKNLWNSVKKGGAEDILLTRFEKGAKVARVLYPDKGAFDDIEYFNVFGPTIIATNTPVDDILNTRCTTITMHESTKQFTTEVKPENCLELRERFLALRAYYYNSELPIVEKPTKGRLGDILKCMRQIIVLLWPEEEKDFMKFVQILMEERKEAKSETIHPQLVKVIVSLELLVFNGKLPIKDITEGYNEGKNIRFHTTTRSVGWKLNDLGFQKVTLSNGTKAIIYDKLLINKLCEDYGIIKINTAEIAEDNPLGG